MKGQQERVGDPDFLETVIRVLCFSALGPGAFDSMSGESGGVPFSRRRNGRRAK